MTFCRRLLCLFTSARRRYMEASLAEGLGSNLASMERNITTHTLRTSFPRRACFPIAASTEDAGTAKAIPYLYGGALAVSSDEDDDSDDDSHDGRGDLFAISKPCLAALRREVCRLTAPRRFHGVALNGVGLAALARGLARTAGTGVGHASYSHKPLAKYAQVRRSSICSFGSCG